MAAADSPHLCDGLIKVESDPAAIVTLKRSSSRTSKKLHPREEAPQVGDAGDSVSRKAAIQDAQILSQMVAMAPVLLWPQAGWLSIPLYDHLLKKMR